MNQAGARHGGGRMVESFYRMIDRLDEAASRRDERKVEREIWAAYGRRCVVFVLDLSGFSETCRRNGICHYLTMIRRMHRAGRDALATFRGALVKFEADNMFAVFGSVDDACDCAVALNGAFRGMNLVEEEVDKHIGACIGIGIGRILLVPGADFFGDAVNQACRLGEDLARRDEILLTPAAYRALRGKQRWRFRERRFKRASNTIVARKLIYRRPGA